MNKYLKQIILLTLVLFATLAVGTSPNMVAAACNPKTMTGAACTPPKTAALKSSLTAGLQLRGVNRAGAEYGEDWCGWTGQTYYEWPSEAIRTSELNYYASKGMNTIRLPISWERLQHTLYGPLDPTYQANLVAYVNAA